MGLLELQVSVTNKCEIGCPYCYKSKLSPTFLSIAQMKKIIEIAKSQNIEAIRFTGGDIFEHKENKEMLKLSKESGLKTVLNISSRRIGLLEEILPFSDYILISFQNSLQIESSKEKLKELITKNPTKIFMGCSVFQSIHLAKETIEKIKEIPLSDFFFLRNVEESSKGYLLSLVSLSEILSTETKGKIKNPIKIANAFPLCYVSMNSQKVCDGGKNDDGKSFVYINENGDIKLNSYSSIVLGNINEPQIAQRFSQLIENAREKCDKVVDSNYYCKKCKIKEKCHGGIIAKEDYTQDSLIKFQKDYMTDHSLMSPLQKNLINFLPNTDFTAEAIPLYFRHSDFFMQYPTMNTWTEKTTKEDMKEKLRQSKKEAAIYIHLPFCNSRCSFCSVKKYPNQYIESYVNFLLEEIESFRDFLSSNRIKYLYIGGGTPSIIGKDNFKRIFDKLFSYIKKEDLKEITLEAFPSNFNKELYDYLSAYITRISIGVQCFDNKILQDFNRPSAKEEIVSFMNSLKEYPFTKSIDIIYGLYLENPEKFSSDLNKMLSLYPDQITFQPLHNYKKITESDEVFFLKYAKILDKLNRLGREMLKQKGYFQYTSEDFCLGEKKFQYQLNLLDQGTVLGLGINTYSFIEGTYYSHLSKESFQKYTLSPGQIKIDSISKGIRNMSLNLEEIDLFSDSVSYLKKFNFIKIDKDTITVTEEGKNYLDLISQILMLNNFDYKIK